MRSFAYEPFHIPSGSMVPTLLIGDFLFVSKASYGYGKFSVPFGLGPAEGRLWFDPPERGDIAVFRKPTDDSVDYIKRIIGLPGDRIYMQGGVLHIDGKAVERRRIDDYLYVDKRNRRYAARQYVETLPNGVSYRVLDVTERGRWTTPRSMSSPRDMCSRWATTATTPGTAACPRSATSPWRT